MVAAPPTSRKWFVLGALAIAEALAMSLWMSTNAIVPQLTVDFGLGVHQAGTLMLVVQLGFVVGTLASALTNLADRLAAPVLISASCFLAAAATAATTLVNEYGIALLALRFAVGLCLAGVYPPGMKLVASWCTVDRGMAIGLLVGALTLGKALPHLFSAYDMGLPPWREVTYLTALIALVAAVIVIAAVRSGPNLPRAAHFHWRHAVRALSHRPTRLANFGYFGHMWELYAMWTWVPAMLLAAFVAADWSMAAARWAAFTALGMGALGSLVAGSMADRWGRTRITIWSMAISGACCIVAGLVFHQPWLLVVVCVVWGATVVADSAQFSAAVTELTDPRYVGTALTIQTCLGFALTTVTIALVPVLVEWLSWRYAMAFLALGPVAGIIAMARLRGLPEARQMAGGRR